MRPDIRDAAAEVGVKQKAKKKDNLNGLDEFDR